MIKPLKTFFLGGEGEGRGKGEGRGRGGGRGGDTTLFK